ncbi:hypothetical protein PAL_GLEAN10024525 [Pteropus alecto]|uniref:Uncharacterized protein n=1 Tax=Pteropus alecto TaxID=9402 RepID=L5K1D9_PTEAL|nr:hypothetical protein PAL_GLEAN10024525 [Pteropus alecto]
MCHICSAQQVWVNKKPVNAWAKGAESEGQAKRRRSVIPSSTHCLLELLPLPVSPTPGRPLWAASSSTLTSSQWPERAGLGPL